MKSALTIGGMLLLWAGLVAIGAWSVQGQLANVSQAAEPMADNCVFDLDRCPQVSAPSSAATTTIPSDDVALRPTVPHATTSIVGTSPTQPARAVAEASSSDVHKTLISNTISGQAIAAKSKSAATAKAKKTPPKPVRSDTPNAPTDTGKNEVATDASTSTREAPVLAPVKKYTAPQQRGAGSSTDATPVDKPATPASGNQGIAIEESIRTAIDDAKQPVQAALQKREQENARTTREERQKAERIRATYGRGQKALDETSTFTQLLHLQIDSE
jgi:hypothetical protein